MFDYDKCYVLGDIIDEKMNEITSKYTQLFEKVPLPSLIRLSFIYASKRLNVMKEITPKGVDERFNAERDREYNNKKALMEQYIQKYYGKSITVESEEYTEFINELLQQEQMDLDSAYNLLEKYKEELSKTYEEIVPYVDIALPAQGLTTINATKHRENQYLNEIVDGIYATSGKGIMDYIVRTNTGSMRGDGYNLELPKNPFKTISEGKYMLNNPASIYHLKVDEFEPVIDFYLDSNNKVVLRFSQEWISRKMQLPCTEEIVDYLPAAYINNKNITVNGENLESLLQKNITY